MEAWKPVPYPPFGEKYEVSNLGSVRAITPSKYANNKGAPLRPGYGSRGYACVTLYHGKLSKQCFIHRMVALAFIGAAPKGKSLVCHKDDDKRNNAHGNLFWGDNSDNMRDMTKKKRSMYGERNVKAKMTADLVAQIRAEATGAWGEQGRLAAKYGIVQTQVSRILRGDHWRHVE